MAYAYKRAITIDHTKCGSTDSLNFPLYFSGHSDLATVANGGFVRSSSGFDIAFFSDSALTTKLAWETVDWSATTGSGEWHIKVPLSASTDLKIYVAFGDSGTITDQSDRTGSFESNYKVVTHFGSASSLSLNDSTSNATNATGLNSPTASAGKVGGAIGLNGSNQSVYMPSNLFSDLTVGTLSLWVKFSSVTGTSHLVYQDGSGHDSLGLSTDAGIHFELQGSYFDSNFAGLTTGVWYALDITWDGTTIKLYLNGSLDRSFSSTASPGTPPSGVSNSSVGSYSYGSGGSNKGNYLNGQIDEFRLSSVARSPSAILSKYNNQNSPGSFYSLGSRTSAYLDPDSALFWIGN